MRFTFFSIILFLLLVSCTYSQDSQLDDLDEEFESLMILGFDVIGNTYTKDIVITRELKMQIGELYEEDRLIEDQKRIQNLNLFSRVEIVPVFNPDGVIIQILVSERWHIFPYPILYRNERDWSKLSYGAGIFHDNFRGLRNFVNTSFWFGYNPGMDVYYSNPWFGGKHKLNYKFSAYSRTIRSKGLAYDRFDEKHHGATLTLGKRWGYHLYLSMSLGYRQVSLPTEYRFLNYSNSKTDRLPSVGFAIKYDKRDLWEYPKSGFFAELYVNKISNASYIDYLRYGADLRKYFNVFKDVSIGFYGRADLSTGSVPYYDKIYLGYAYRIRGEFDTRMEGDNRAIGRVELRFPIIPIKYFDLSEQGYDFGSYSNNLPFGLSGGLFVDSGTTWFKSQSITDQARLKGFGLGLHFHVPYVQLLRVEYAWNSDFEPQFITDIGVAF